MSNEVLLASTLASLKFIASTPALKRAANYPHLAKCVGEFKRKLIESLDSSQLSDAFLKNAAECLYELRACDRKTSYHLSKAFERRAGIISNQLKGGVLWAYFNNPSLSRARRKVVNSSCRVAIKQAVREFLDLKENVTHIAGFGPILRNLKVVGDCYRVPVSPKARLEQAILESSEVLKLSLECAPLLLPMFKAFSALRIDNEQIARTLLGVFSDRLERDDHCTPGEISAILAVMSRWQVSTAHRDVPCIAMFTEMVEGGKANIWRNAANAVKLLTAALSLPNAEAKRELCSAVLSGSDRLANFCSNRDLVTLAHAASEFRSTYPDAEQPSLDEITANLETYREFGGRAWRAEATVKTGAWKPPELTRGLELRM